MFLRRAVRSISAMAVATGVTVSLPVYADAATSALQIPQLTISKNHGAPFFRGQTGQYSIFVHNQGDAPTLGPVDVEEVPPTGLTVTAMAGDGWTCTLADLTCTRSDSLPGGSTYPTITVTVAVAEDAPDTVVNVARVSGGGSASAEDEDPTNVVTPATPADLSISKSHSGSFPQGGTGTYTLTVSNASAAGTTGGPVTVTDTLPAGVTYNSASSGGPGWTCSESAGTVTCTRSDPLAPGDSYPPLALSVNVTSAAGCTFTNSATVSGGGSEPANANDSTTVTGGTCGGGNGGGGNGNGGGTSILPINLSGLLPAYNNISINNPIHSPGATSNTNQNFALNGS
ncbi:DUF11 domain-containing protein [Streptomyces sp. NPDC006393]|uniref:DUF11 domain-containing protein n=1 Tax=Streptomyces sp. NPDC006393 TaxID=3156763 RepID=UPI0033DEBEFB